MKKFITVISLLVVYAASFSQDQNNEETRGFKREKVFFGGGFGLGLGGWDGGFNVGANPETGYEITKWLHAGISTNINYYSFRAEINNGMRQRSLNYGVGVFTRIFPVRNVFLQVLPEYNKVTHRLKDYNDYLQTQYKIKTEAPSLLLGIGYSSSEEDDANFYSVLMFDAGNNPNS
ncbi:MAG TPA: hypothetical protein VF540_11275, partial [Segetibacter sp.]